MKIVHRLGRSGLPELESPLRLVLLTLLLLSAGLIAACAGGDPHAAGGADHAGAAAQADRDHAGHDDHLHGEPLGVPADFSIYNLDALWTDQHGHTRQLVSLGGRVQVVSMIYTNCGYACPRILMDMRRIEAELPAGYRDRVGFVMVSIDPDRDTPERLAEYADAARLDPARWTLLTAPDNTVLELAALLGVKYRRISETDFSHTNVITVLDQWGGIAHRQVGLGEDPARTLRVIRELMRSPYR